VFLALPQPLPFVRLRFLIRLAFDRHRVGVYVYTHARGLELDTPREDGRRCLDATEMLEAGMASDLRGRWSIVADVERARRAFAEAA
jgi:hypothetical protein